MSCEWRYQYCSIVSLNISHLFRLGFPKRAEDFVFFTIQDVAGFKSALKQLQPLITSTAEVQAFRKQIDDNKKCGNHDLLKIVGTNIAFSAAGLKKVFYSLFSN